MRRFLGKLGAVLLRRFMKQADSTEIAYRQQRGRQQEQKLHQQEREFEELREFVRRQVRGLWH